MDEAADMMITVIAGHRVVSDTSYLHRWWLAEAGGFCLMMPRVLIEDTQVFLGRVGGDSFVLVVIIFLRSSRCFLLILLILLLVLLNCVTISWCIFLLLVFTAYALSIVECENLERVRVVISAACQHYRLALFVKKFGEACTLLALWQLFTLGFFTRARQLLLLLFNIISLLRRRLYLGVDILAQFFIGLHLLSCWRDRLCLS